MTDRKDQDIFRKLLASMERRRNRNFFVLFQVGGVTKSKYDMSQPFEIDAKSPQDWLNSCFFFYNIGEFGNGKIGLKVQVSLQSN
jgi:hypothetical protein